MNKHYYSWQDIEDSCTDIIVQMYNDNWRPDYIVGLTRGGNVPATIISNKTGIRCEALKVSLRDNTGRDAESNLWMADDAFEGKNILIVDDINDTGSTFNWIVEDWQDSAIPTSSKWDNIWGNNVRFAVITDNLSSDFKYATSYSTFEVNKAEDDVWLVYPWEK